MIKTVKWFSIILGIIILTITILVLTVIFSENGKILLPVKHKEKFILKEATDYPSLVLVKDNQIIDLNGNTIIFKGLMPADPARLHNLNKFNKKFFKGIKEIGANIIRIPVHPENWVKDKDYLWRYLDPIVEWAGELDMYVIIDWHYIGNISTGVVQNNIELDIHPYDLTIEFWEKTAKYFLNAPHVLFEIFNEPANIMLEDWIKNAKEIVEVIRKQGAKQIIIVGGTQYSKNLSWVSSKPIKDKNIVYAAHIYPAHNDSSWPFYFGNVSRNYPVLITEWGFIDENDGETKQMYLVGNAESYGEPLLEYLRERNIGWIGCWYDNTWEPEMFKADFKQLTNYGEFIMENLSKKHLESH